ncbi:hypothetical protein BC827DRAFT_1272194 [Russula dissimulans]|nr:hypothetical protein BC827DRAFT_1272194 [Russula dissimulans]
MILVRRLLSTRAFTTPLLRSIQILDPQSGSSDPHSPWTSVTSCLTLDSAVAQLESLTGRPNDYPSLDAVHPPPTWLLVRLCSKVKSPADAEKASHLIITHLPHIPPPLRPSVLILVVHLLSAYRVLPELDRVIKLFIGLPLFHEFWHFNHLLQALTHYANSPTDARYLARLAVLLLKTMTERELSLTRKAYGLLLRNRYITMELTEELRQRMIRDKIVPDRAHLESLLRIFTHHDSIHDASSYARAIHRIYQMREESPKRSGLAHTDQIIPSSTVQYLSHLVHENSQRNKFNADAEWSRFLITGISHRFRNKQNTSAAAWASRLISLSQTWSFSPESLVAFFDWSHAQHFPFRTHTTLSYTIVLRGLLRKRAYTLALEVWERCRKHGTRKLHLDPVALGVGVEVLTRAGNPDRALALIESLVDGAPALRASRPPSPTISGSTVPASIVARFMRALIATNPSAALRLWEHMGILYGSTPDALTFTILLDAARYATLNGESFTGAMQELGFDFRFRLPFGNSELEPDLVPASAESLDRARRRSYATLKRSLAVNEGDMWGKERAWRRAHRIFTNALLAGWPALANVRAPARAVRASGESPATAPLRDLKRFLVPPPSARDGNGDDDDDSDAGGRQQHPLIPHDARETAPSASASSSSSSSFPHRDYHDHEDLLRSPPLLPIHPRGAYPSFAPDDATFRASILLLGAARAAGEIPQTLAWMRALGIAPRTRTLAYALVFWAEVSVGAPLLERLALRRGGGGGGGEYRRFVVWLEEWVGVENVPDEAAIGEAMRRVDAMRHGRDRGTVVGRG